MAAGVDTLIDVLGWMATACFGLILVPQIIMNQYRKSCEGFSISLLLLWHIGAATVFPFFIYEEEPTPLMLQGGLFTLASVICEVQFYAFRPDRPKPPALKLWAFGLTNLLVSAGSIVGLMVLFESIKGSTSAWLIDGIGSILSSVCFALGFLPQINLMFTNRSSEGFSVGVSLLDLLGSALSIVVLLLEAEDFHADPDTVMPYAIIVSFQSLLLLMALVVYPDPDRWANSKAWAAWCVERCRLSDGLCKGWLPALLSHGSRMKKRGADDDGGVIADLHPDLDFTRHSSRVSSSSVSLSGYPSTDSLTDPHLEEEIRLQMIRVHSRSRTGAGGTTAGPGKIERLATTPSSEEKSEEDGDLKQESEQPGRERRRQRKGAAISVDDYGSEEEEEGYPDAYGGFEDVELGYTEKDVEELKQRREQAQLPTPIMGQARNHKALYPTPTYEPSQ